MSINKIIYFIVERALTENGNLITDAKIEAWQHGPVFREIYHAFKEFGENPITSRAKRFDSNSRSMVIAEGVISPSDAKIFESTLDQYIELSAAHLRALSHREGGPWHRVWWHDSKLNPGMEISAEIILASHNSEQIQ